MLDTAELRIDLVIAISNHPPYLPCTITIINILITQTFSLLPNPTSKKSTYLVESAFSMPPAHEVVRNSMEKAKKTPIVMLPPAFT